MVHWEKDTTSAWYIRRKDTTSEQKDTTSAWYIGRKDTTSEQKDTTSAWYIGQKIPPQHCTFEIESQPKSREELLCELPKELHERVVKLGKWASWEKVSQLLVDLCAFKPYSYEELALIIQRAAKPMKDKYIKPLRLANKLFYWIPEMINHPLQKYVADPSMARSNTKKN